jgi:hypothetical protein
VCFAHHAVGAALPAGAGVVRVVSRGRAEEIDRESFTPSAAGGTFCTGSFDVHDADLRFEIGFAVAPSSAPAYFVVDDVNVRDEGPASAYAPRPLAALSLGPQGLLVNDHNIFAAAADGKAYRWTGATWQPVGVVGAVLAIHDEGLFSLSPGGTDVRELAAGDAWRSLGAPPKPPTEILAGGRRLFAHIAGDSIYEYRGASAGWVFVGGPGAEFGVRADGRLYGVFTNREHLLRYSDVGVAWEQIWSVDPGGNISLTALVPGSEMFATFAFPGAATKDGLYRPIVGSYYFMAPPSAAFVGTRDAVLRLTSPRTSVLRWSPVDDVWTQVAGPAAAIYGGASRMLVIAPDGRTPSELR